jgi:hypothetical protein
MHKIEWLILIVSLPGPTKAARMRLWRALRASGAGALRDGVYALPNSPAATARFQVQAAEVIASGGSAELIVFAGRDAAQEERLLALFDRGPEHAKLIERTQAVRACIGNETDAEVRRRLTGLRREAATLAAVDYFPGPAAAQLEQALSDTEAAREARADGDEPHARRGGVPRRDVARYQGRLWATRQHLWVDRVASAWLIRRFIDSNARFRWLRQPKDCPKTAVGFDFDGAEFSHVGARVTFEVLLASFGLDHDPALVRLGSVVHALDVGGAPAAEAAGLAAIMAGYRARGLDDDTLLAEAGGVFDALHAGFQSVEDSTP